MNSPKFTKGPWQIIGPVPEEGSDCFWIQAQPHPAMRGFTKSVATVDDYQNDEEAQANAYLIVSAPDMYSELERILNEEEQYRFEDWLEKTYPSGCVESVEAQWKMSTEYAIFEDEYHRTFKIMGAARGETYD